MNDFPLGHEKNGGGEYETVDAGVRIINRYRMPRETAVMFRVLRSLPTDLHGIVETIFCDSKYGSAYTVEVNTKSQKKAQDLASWMSSRFVLFAGGHSHIHVRTDILNSNTEIFTHDPCWDQEAHEQFAAKDAERLALLGQSAWTTTLPSEVAS